MREEEGDTRQKGEEWKGASVRAQSQCPLPLHRLEQLLRTGSDYCLPGGGGRNGAVQHATLCAAHLLRAEQRRHLRSRHRVGYALDLLY